LFFRDDTRPGLLSRSQQRKNELEKAQLLKNSLNKTQGVKVIEETKRNEALAKSIIESEKTNIGLNMMKKMGFKIGESLGKQGTSGIIEPIGIKMKTGREGLGRDEVVKRKLQENEDKIKKSSKQRIISDEFSKNVFIKTKKQMFQLKQIKSRLHKAQNICFQLDSSKVSCQS
jgi:hypothetical protein